MRRIVAAYGVNQLGTWFGVVALAVTVYDHTHNAAAVAAMFAAAQAIPGLFVPAAVAFLDGKGGRWLFALLYTLEAILTVLIIVFVAHFWLPAILVLAMADGLIALSSRALVRAAASRAGASAAASSPVGDEEAAAIGTRRANSMMNAALTATVIVGPATAGVLVSVIGPTGALWIDTGSFLACAVALWGVSAAAAQRPAGSFGERLLEGWQYLREVEQLRRLLVCEFVALIAFTSAIPVEVLYAKSSLHAGDRGYGFILAGWGVGLMIGTLTFTHWKRRPLAPLLTVGTLAIGCAYLGMAFSPTLLGACVAAVLGGAGNGVQWISLTSLAQELTPARLHGRLLGVVEAISAIAQALAFPIGGAIAALTSPRIAMGTSGTLAVLMTVPFWRFARPTARARIAAPDASAPDVAERAPQLTS